MPRIVFVSDGVTGTSSPGMTVLDVAIAQKIPHFRECGGNGRCTTCRVRIVDGIQNTLPRTPRETEVADALGWDRFTRLACQTRVSGDVSIERLITSCADVSRALVTDSSASPPEEKPLAVLICDIRDFTPFVERHLAYDVLHILNRFFESVGDAILMNNGVIYQYVGDQIIGLFGLGGDAAAKSCFDALRAGFAMLNALDDLNAQLLREFGTTLEIGIGAHSGPLIVGMLGHSSHRHFSVIGDAINVASRIEEANKTLGTRFLVSEVLFSQIPDATVKARRTQAVLKGIDDPVQLVEPLAFGPPDNTLLVQSTIGVLMEHQQRFTAELYQRLFELIPQARALFRGDMETQGQMLSHMLQFLVYAMGRPETMSLGLQSLGRRHADYGVPREYYPFFQQAFLEALRVVLADRHTPHVEQAWADTLEMIINAMVEPLEAKPGQS
jgi:class 3 adenylate cyclase/hemoglobin-like flavoprotein